MTPAPRVVGFLLAFLCCMCAPGFATPVAQEAEAAATAGDVRRLYESADYEQAMRIVDALLAKGPLAADEQRLLQRYRALCLLAFGKTGEAEATIETLLRGDPLFAPDGDMPPRLTAMVNEARGRMARSLVTETYQRGRDRLKSGETAAARTDMTTVVAMIDDPTLQLGDDPFFAQLRLLADGFRALSASPTQDAMRESTRPATDDPGAPAESTAASRTPVATLSLAPSPTNAGSTNGFVAPRAVAQPLPRFASSSGGVRREGEITVDIAADGSVTAARMTLGISPAFDASLVDAAKRWRYTPATRLGVPVPYTMRVRVVVPGR
jgi:TonB family protein